MKHSYRCSHQSSRGLTFMELLVASVLIGVVTLGAAGVLLGMRNIQGSSRLESFLVMHSAAVMGHIQRNVLQATGYQSDPGIVISSGTTPPYYSFRQDVDSSAAINNTPQTYADDTWLIYVQDTSSTLSYCRQTTASGSAPTAGCLASLTELSNKIQTLTFTWTSSTTDFYVSVVLNTIYDPATAYDVLKNPTYALTTKVTPTAHTW